MLFVLTMFTISTTISLLLIVLSTEYKATRYYGCPKYIYENSKLNKFGVFASVLVLAVAFPLYYIFWFVYWLCHIGRE